MTCEVTPQPVATPKSGPPLPPEVGQRRLCYWQAVYEEYLVIVAVVRPDLELAEIERLVEAVDARMKEHLRGR